MGQIIWKDSGWLWLGCMPLLTFDQSLCTKGWSTLVGQAWLLDSALWLTAGKVLTLTVPPECQSLGMIERHFPNGRREPGIKKQHFPTTMNSQAAGEYRHTGKLL